jgi:hypothetical protein
MDCWLWSPTCVNLTPCRRSDCQTATPSAATAFGVCSQRKLQFVSDPEVIDNQPTGFVIEHTIDTGDCLHQAMPSHRLVHIHRVQRGDVESREPHVPNDHDLEGIFRRVLASYEVVLTAVRQRWNVWTTRARDGIVAALQNGHSS